MGGDFDCFDDGHRAARGASLVDVLVGLAVAMVTFGVVYEAFVAMDTVRRNAASVADAQGNASFALFALASQIGNAGAGWSSAARWLETCPLVADPALTLRPVHVIITDGGAAASSDSLIVRQSFARAAVPAAIAAAAPAGTHVRIESPDGFAPGDRIVAITRTGDCATTQATGITGPVGGVVDVTHSGIAIALPITSVLVNLGPAARASTVRFDVASGSLRSTDVANADAPVPIVPNVVNVKFQYGIDTDGNGTLDTWVRAEMAGPWSPAALLAAPRTTLERIVAVRVGIIVRGDRIERALTRDFDWVLFDCEQEDKSTCPGRLEGTIAGGAQGSYRYRTLETVVPLRNVIWNRGG
jgi:type IV pilus assembly protein PilW